MLEEYLGQWVYVMGFESGAEDETILMGRFMGMHVPPNNVGEWPAVVMEGSEPVEFDPDKRFFMRGVNEDMKLKFPVMAS